MKQYINEAKRLQQLAGIDEAMHINNKGELQNFPLEKDIEDAAHLQSLNFNVFPIDPDEKFYYFEFPDGSVSIASKNKNIILNLKKRYPERYKNAILKYDNQWQTGENEDDELNEISKMQQLAGISELMQVTPQGKLQDLNIPSGWELLKIDQDQDPEQDMEIESYGAPMEGWDEDHLDVVTIMKTPEIDPFTDEPQEVKYYVTTYISFGDFTESEQFNNFDDAKAEAVNIMNDLKSDWGR